MSAPTAAPARSTLAEILGGYESVLVGFSGGVDSGLVAVLARQVLGKANAIAALGVSASLSAVQREQSERIARDFDLNLVIVDTNELDDPDYVANRPNRCFFCKQELWLRLGAVAAERGLRWVVDGTNADDLAASEHRPGQAAGASRHVRAPLAEAGYTKADVRREARALGLPIWDAPAAPCLSSRIQYGLSVTPERLRQVEAGEAWLRSLGVAGDFRVRHRGDEARIEANPDQFGRIRAARTDLVLAFHALGFARVSLDLSGYRRGSLLDAGAPALEAL